MSLHEQVITLFLASQKAFLAVEKAQIKEYQKAILAYFEKEHTDIVKEIEQTKDLSETLKQRILDAAEKFKSRWN